MYKSITPNLMVQSVDRAIDFYKEILDFSVIASVPGPKDQLQFAILINDGIMLMMQEKNSITAEYPILDTPKICPSISLYIIVDNFQELYETISKKCPIYSQPHTTPYGAEEFAIIDIDGYVITFAKQQDN